MSSKVSRGIMQGIEVIEKIDKVRSGLQYPVRGRL
jgi:hypothetical protein